MNESVLRETMARLARSLFERGYAVGSAGNISAAVDDGILITPTNSCLGFLDPARIAKIDRSGRHVSGDPALCAMIHDLNGSHAAVLLANHGPAVAAKDLESAVYASEELEETARLVLLLRGQKVRLLDESQVAELIPVFDARR